MGHRVNTESSAIRYKPGQCSEHFLPWVKGTPKWMIDCGPGSAFEWVEAKAKWPDLKGLALEPSPEAFEVARHRFEKLGKDCILPTASCLG